MLRDSRLYAFLITVIEERSFTAAAAAARLGVAQPWLSTRIRQLEAELGVSLFRRTTRTVEATPAALRLLPHARQVVAAMETFDAEARALAGTPAPLRVGAPPYLAYVPAGREIIDDFGRRRPDIGVDMDIGWSIQLRVKLLAGDLDAAFLMAVGPHEALEEIEIDAIGLDLELAAQDPLAARQAVTAADLAGRQVEMFTRAFNPIAFDSVSEALRVQGAEIVERRALWSAPASNAAPPPIAVRMRWPAGRRRSGHVRRPLDFVDPFRVTLARACGRSRPGLDELFELGQEAARRRAG